MKNRYIDIDPGMMDERVQIDSYTVTNDADTNEEILSYTLLSEAWAYVRYANKISDEEVEILDRESVILKYIITIRYNAAIGDHKMRVMYRGDYYDIEAIRELGRKEYIVLYCKDIE